MRAHEPHAFRLPLDVVFGEHRIDVGFGRESRRVPLVLVTGGHLEEHGFARHAVAGIRRARHHRVGRDGCARPPLQRFADLTEVTPPRRIHLDPAVVVRHWRVLSAPG